MSKSEVTTCLRIGRAEGAPEMLSSHRYRFPRRYSEHKRYLAGEIGEGVRGVNLTDTSLRFCDLSESSISLELRNTNEPFGCVINECQLPWVIGVMGREAFKDANGLVVS